MTTTIRTTLDEAALYAACVANPLEDTPRLMYADYLEDDDQTERAELIKVGVELARLKEPNYRDVKTGGRIGATPRQLAKESGCVECTSTPGESLCRFHECTERQAELLLANGCGLLLRGGLREWKRPKKISIDKKKNGQVDSLYFRPAELIAGVDRGLVGKCRCMGEVWATWGNHLRRCFPLVEVTLTNAVLFRVPEKEMLQICGRRWSGITFKFEPSFSG
jgi:uncharacterized protein (TIGR02996 family)